MANRFAILANPSPTARPPPAEVPGPGCGAKGDRAANLPEAAPRAAIAESVEPKGDLPQQADAPAEPDRAYVAASLFFGSSDDDDRLTGVPQQKQKRAVRAPQGFEGFLVRRDQVAGARRDRGEAGAAGAALEPNWAT
jgi:hypothetical protein